ncbi:MAG: class I SAM-dependent methyltransferase [Acidobacteria bacterium]|nr:class I SAM-dependent methyltransferase [Acidobacteriota bacterium]
MGPAEDPDTLKAEELQAIIREVRERVRARHPQTAVGPLEIALPDLLPIVHARDAAEAKVAAIGTVNPRAGGPLNRLIQAAKRMAARALDWHIREQVDFNRNAMVCVDATLEALNDVNRALVKLGNEIGSLRRLENEARELKDIRSHWSEWRVEWERKLSVNEVQFLRSVADMQGAFQLRATQMESNFREIVKSQHADFETALERNSLDVQKRLWADLERVRVEYERLIHSELRLLRQRAAFPQPAPPEAAPAASHFSGASAFDYGRFAERFRGSRELVRGRQKFYLPFFTGCREVLDIGCGRGEFLELMREAGVPARGVDLVEESVALCRQQGLQAEVADLYQYLGALPDASLDGIFSAQVVEHLPPERLPGMLRLAAAKLARGGVLAMETPNPQCLAIFATHFYLDPTHTRPIPHPLLAFYMEEYGLGGIEVHPLSPAVESMPALASLPEEFRNAFFGGLDYAIIGRKL